MGGDITGQKKDDYRGNGGTGMKWKWRKGKPEEIKNPEEKIGSLTTQLFREGNARRQDRCPRETMRPAEIGGRELMKITSRK